MIIGKVVKGGKRDKRAREVEADEDVGRNVTSNARVHRPLWTKSTHLKQALRERKSHQRTAQEVN